MAADARRGQSGTGGLKPGGELRRRLTVGGLTIWLFPTAGALIATKTP